MANEARTPLRCIATLLHGPVCEYIEYGRSLPDGAQTADSGRRTGSCRFRHPSASIRAGSSVSWAVTVLGDAVCGKECQLSSNSQFTVPLGQRQLFLDGHGLARVENLVRTMHQPEKKGAVIRSPGPTSDVGGAGYLGP